MDRGDEWAALSSIVATVNHAIRCVLVLNGVPYPYVKWLYVAATASSTGRAVLRHVDNILDLVRSKWSALRGPEKDNEISTTLRLIRGLIVEQANAIGIDEPWLNRWWHYVNEARNAFEEVEWSV